MKKYTVDRGCTFCGTCVFECPAEAITLGENGASINPEKCTGCGRCYENCASEAISVVDEEAQKKGRKKGDKNRRKNNQGTGEGTASRR